MKTLLCAFCCVCICATVCFVAVMFSDNGRSNPPRHLWSPVVIDNKGNETILGGDTRQLEFWTPSAETRNYLQKDHDEYFDTEKWEVLSNDDPVVQFGMLIHSNANVLGYRRVAVWGQGRTSFKPGWWWTVNVLTNYSAANMGLTYQKYWNTSQSVFIEVVDNRGSAE